MTRLALVALAAAACALPFALGPYPMHVADLVLVYVLLAIGFSLVMGYAGQISLAHVAFFGVGAYASALLTTAAGWSAWAAMPAATLAAVACAFVTSIPALRVQSHYLAIVTLGLAIAFAEILTNARFMGGPEGIGGIPAPSLLGYRLADDRSYYYLLLLAVALFGALARFVLASSIGRAFRAIRDDAVAASALGVHVGLVRMAAFAFSGLYAGAAGALYAHFVHYVSPDTFGLQVMFFLLAAAMIGGLDNLYGASAGAALLILARELLRDFQSFEQVAYGALIVVMAVFLPGGLASVVSYALRRAGRRGRRPAAVEGGGAT